MSKTPHILIAAPNPAWDRTLSFEQFTAGEVNRAATLKEFAAGKGINAARAVATWHQARATVVQFAGGEWGEKLLVRLVADDIANRTIKTAAATRSCTTCIDKCGTMTEIIDPTAPPTAAELTEYMAAFAELAADADGYIATGTAPGNSTREFCRLLTAELAKQPKMLLLDATKEAEELIHSGLVTCLKVNLAEACGIADCTPDKLPARLARLPIPIVAVTNGAAEAFITTPSGRWRYRLPAVGKPISPLGAGDTAAGVMATELLRGTAPQEAFKFALAAASASTLNIFCGHFPVADAAQIYSKIEIEEF